MVVCVRSMLLVTYLWCFFSSRRRHTRCSRDWSSDVCSSDLVAQQAQENVDLVNERYKVGRASAVEVTDAQVALSQAQSDQGTARFDYLAAVAQVQRTIGE